MEKRKIILCPNPYRDKDMHVAAQSKAILDEAGFETVVCLPFQKEGYGADLGLPIGQLPQEVKRADPAHCLRRRRNDPAPGKDRCHE